MARRSPGRLGGRGRMGVLAALALLIAAAVVVVLVVRSSPSSTSGSHNSAGTTGRSATVRRRNLVATDTESGTLSYAGSQTVYNRLSGTVTWLPAVGREIRPAGVLYRIDGQPVILMDGSAPAYRTLSAADVDGPDVLELNRNLKRLGFDAAGITVDDVWQPGTSLGVEELQDSLGEEATGSLTLGQVVFLPGPQLVSVLDTTVGSTGSGGGSSGSAQATSAPPLAGSAEFVSSTRPVSTTTSTTSTIPTTPTTTSTSPTTTTTTGATTTPTTTTGTRPPAAPTNTATKALSALAKQLRAETAQLKAATAALRAAGKSSHSSSSSSHHSGGGSTGGSAQAIMQTASTRLVVTVDLSASSQSEARVGDHVTVEMPGGNTVNARVVGVSRIAQSSSSAGDQGGAGSSGSGGSGSGSSSTVPVTIALSGHHRTAGLDQAAVSVNFVSQSARHVLSVPVTALVATSGSQYALQEASAAHTLIPVSVGLFAAGYVQVSGSGVHSGLAVTDSQG